MNQQEFIESRIQRSNAKKREESESWRKREGRNQEIQTAYEDFVIRGFDQAFWIIVPLINEHVKSWLYKQNRPLYGVDFDDILHDADLVLRETMLKDREAGEPRDGFPGYAVNLIKNKYFDSWRDNNVSKTIRYSSSEMEEHLNASETRLVKNEGTKNRYKQPAYAIEDKPVTVSMNKTLAFDSVINEYLKELFAYPGLPQEAIAAYYARVLPHISDEGSDKVAVSVKGAFRYMGKMSMIELSEDSERTCFAYSHTKFRWNDSFRKQLTECKVTVSERVLLLRDVVFTEKFREKEVERWSEKIHKYIIKQFYLHYEKDPAFAKLFLEHFPKTSEKMGIDMEMGGEV